MNEIESLKPIEMVILDGYTLNPGDLHWKPLEAIGKCKIYDRSTTEQVIDRIGDGEIVLTNKAIIDRRILKACANLKYIGVLATGYNVVDVKAANEHGIVVTNAPGYSTSAVAQMVFSHILNFTQNVEQHGMSVRRGVWSKSPDFCYWITPLTELQGKTLGLVGFGQIGQAVARIARAFDMHVLVYKPNPPTENPAGVSFVDKKTLFKESDVVSLHCPLTDATHHIVCSETLAWMKPTAYLINTGRGDLVDEEALAKTLGQQLIAGAGLDVCSKEPIEAGNPLLKLKNCVFTPHIAWATRESRERLIRIVAGNLKAFLGGSPINKVN